MHYVREFNINGVATKQVACIELQGVPNTATEGAVGVLGIDMTSPTHEVYKCVAVNGSVYTWELLSAGMSIISATITGEGGMTKTFPYSALLMPDKYLIKQWDLILDSEGYLYRITSVGADSCDTEYCGTHIGGGGGNAECALSVDGGKLRLVTPSGAVLSEVDTLIPDEETIHRDSETGEGKIIGIKTIDGTLLRFFIGTKAIYDTLTSEQKKTVIPWFTSRDTIQGSLWNDAVDSTPNYDSPKLVTSGGVYETLPQIFEINTFSGNYNIGEWVSIRDVKLAPLPKGKSANRIVYFKLYISHISLTNVATNFIFKDFDFGHIKKVDDGLADSAYFYEVPAIGISADTTLESGSATSRGIGNIGFSAENSELKMKLECRLFKKNGEEIAVDDALRGFIRINKLHLIII